MTANWVAIIALGMILLVGGGFGAWRMTKVFAAIRTIPSSNDRAQSELSLQERLVHAAETAIEEASVAKHSTALRVESVEGFPHDLAKAACHAFADELATFLRGQRAIGVSSDPYIDIPDMELLAQLIRDVPALKAV